MCRNLDLRFLLFIVFCQSFFPALFTFFWLSVLLPFLLLSNWFFIVLRFPLLFRYCFILVSLAHVVWSLAYPNLLGTKILGCCCCCIVFFVSLGTLYLCRTKCSLLFMNHAVVPCVCTFCYKYWNISGYWLWIQLCCCYCFYNISVYLHVSYY
jgi:hypothetical protein